MAKRGPKSKPKPLPEAVRYFAFRHHEGNEYRCWTNRLFGDQFDIVSLETLEGMRKACHLLSVPVFYFDVTTDYVEDARRILVDEPTPTE